MTELADYFSDAVNATGRAIVAITCFWLTLLALIFDTVANTLRLTRTWCEKGCKFNYRWMLPGNGFYFPLNKPKA